MGLEYGGMEWIAALRLRLCCGGQQSREDDGKERVGVETPVLFGSLCFSRSFAVGRMEVDVSRRSEK